MGVWEQSQELGSLSKLNDLLETDSSLWLFIPLFSVFYLPCTCKAGKDSLKIYCLDVRPPRLHSYWAQHKWRKQYKCYCGSRVLSQLTGAIGTETLYSYLFFETLFSQGSCVAWTVARFLCPWDFTGKNTGVSCHFLLQEISTQGLNLLHLLHWQADSLPLSHLEA